MFGYRIRRLGVQKESPDVETPGLLVKALISSYFIIGDVLPSLLIQINFSTNILFNFEPAIPQSGYFLILFFFC